VFKYKLARDTTLKIKLQKYHSLKSQTRSSEHIIANQLEQRSSELSVFPPTAYILASCSSDHRV